MMMQHQQEQQHSHPNLPRHFILTKPPRPNFHNNNNNKNHKNFSKQQQQNVDHVNIPFTQYRTLHIFDFDGTLFHTPEPNQSSYDAYRRKTGCNFPMNQYWWTSHESLDSKIFSIAPGPAYAEFYRSITMNSSATTTTRTKMIVPEKTGTVISTTTTENGGEITDQEQASSDSSDTSGENDKNQMSGGGSVATLMMTGRSTFLSKKVFEIMNRHNMRPLLSIFRPNDCRTSTLLYKMDALKMLVQEMFPHVTTIHMWDDRMEHVEQFRTFRLKNAQSQVVQLTVTHVTPHTVGEAVGDGSSSSGANGGDERRTMDWRKMQNFKNQRRGGGSGSRGGRGGGSGSGSGGTTVTYNHRTFREQKVQQQQQQQQIEEQDNGQGNAKRRKHSKKAIKS